MKSQIYDLALVCLFYMFHNLNCEWVENKGLWYYISRYEQPVGYEKAVDICDTLNARLAVITDEEQNDYLEEITHDGESRWIGLSNNKSSFVHDECKDAVYVWNNDWYCDITYTTLDNDNHESKQTSCSGVAFSSGLWTSNGCSGHHGFICQWECKRIFWDFESQKYSGVYAFDHYYNNNFIYYKEKDSSYYIYKSMSRGKWVVRNKKHYKYVHEYELYVPYRKEMSWETDGDGVNAGSLCVECDHITMCLFLRQTEEVCFNNMRLTHNPLYPQYTNTDESAIIKYDPDGDTGKHCIYIKKARLDEIHRCGYLYPNPAKTTNYTFKHNMYNVTISIINNCNRYNIETPATSVSPSPAQSTGAPGTGAYMSQPTLTIDETEKQTSIEEYTTLTFDTTSKSPSAQKSTQNNRIITLSVSIAAVVIAIIIVAVIVSVMFVRRRKRKGHNGEDPGGITMGHDNITNAQYNNNVYIELPESNLKRTTKDSPKESDVEEYSYADFATPSSRQASMEKVDTSTLEGKPSGATNSEVTQNKGYLAPDYAVLMDKNAKQVGKGHANNNNGTNTVYLETRDSKFISQLPGKSGSEYDLQLHENEVYDASADGKRSDNEQDSIVYYNDGLANAENGINPQTKPKKLSNEGCIYQNAVSDSVDGGDDDLELFENSVYEQT